MKHGSLFSGIGGFDLAAEWMNWENVFHCEIDKFCQKVLNHYWPGADSYGNIYEFSGEKYRNAIDIISGGFPCQPFSIAGKRKGKNDHRYLWPQALRVINEIRPRWIVLENVAGLFTVLEPESLSEMEIKTVELFCSNENKQSDKTIERIQGRVIGRIISEIRSAGYVFPRLADGTPILLCVPACAVGAPHRRDRVWFVAHSQYDPKRQTRDSDAACIATKANIFQTNKKWPWEPIFNSGCTNTSEDFSKNPGGGFAPHSNGKGLQREQKKINAPAMWKKRNEQSSRFFDGNCWINWPGEYPVYSNDDGISNRLANISFSKWRKESVRGLGNAIVPQVCYEIFKCIEECSKN